ncbi:MAG: hypothetical protein ACXWCO_00745 [Caldimonas sp.]
MSGIAAAMGAGAGLQALQVTVGVQSIPGTPPTGSAGYEPGGAGGAISPANLHGAPIANFYWRSFTNLFGSGSTHLTLTGNHAGSPKLGRVNGVSLGLSSPGTYDAPSNTTLFAWAPSTNPFGTTVGAVLNCEIS